MFLVLDDVDLAVLPEPSGGFSLRVTHDRLPFALFLPIDKGRAHKLLDAAKENMAPHVQVAGVDDMRKVTHGPEHPSGRAA